jgi:hypothetical protein
MNHQLLQRAQYSDADRWTEFAWIDLGHLQNGDPGTNHEEAKDDCNYYLTGCFEALIQNLETDYQLCKIKIGNY